MGGGHIDPPPGVTGSRNSPGGIGLKANLDSRKAQSGIPENYVITKIDPIRDDFTE